MRQVIFILLAFALISCEQNRKMDNLLGSWEIISATDMETGEIELYNEKHFLEIRSDSLYLISDSSPEEVYSCRIDGDTMFIDSEPIYYIKELNGYKLILEFEFFSSMVNIELKKIKGYK